MSQGQTPQSPAPSPTKSGPRRIRLWVWLLLAAMIGPCAYVQAPREVGRWYLAAAEVERKAGRKELADRYLTRAQAWAADVPIILLTRAVWRAEDGQYVAALEDLTVLDEQLPGNVDILQQRALVLQHLGRHDEAVAAAKAVDRISLTGGIPSRAQALNNLAYTQAVGRRELDEALAAVEKALEFEPHNATFLDTRGFILYQQGKYDRALDDATQAVVDFERRFDRMRSPGRSDMEAVAVMRYHRALVLEKLGRFAEAKADRARAKQLIGREPDETLF